MGAILFLIILAICLTIAGAVYFSMIFILSCLLLMFATLFFIIGSVANGGTIIIVMILLITGFLNGRRRLM